MMLDEENPYDQDSPIYSFDPMEEELMIEWNSQYDYIREAYGPTGEGLEDEEGAPDLLWSAYQPWHCRLNDGLEEEMPW